MNQNNDCDKFYGRETELSELMGYWEEVKKGNPALVTILAESGVGKTRLVQEFYAILAATQNGDISKDKKASYWPTRLPCKDLNLQLNPIFDTLDKKRMEIPWLWWGMRGIDSEERNKTESRCAMEQATADLTPHLVFLTLQKKKEDVIVDSTKKIVGAGINILSLGWATPIMDLLSVVELAGTHSAFWKVRKENELDLDERRDRQAADQCTLVIDSIFSFLKHSDLPVVLILDDMHYFDKDSKNFVTNLFIKLGKQKVKLMVLVTCWKSESKRKDLLEVFKEWKQPDTHHCMSLSGIDNDSAEELIRGQLPGIIDDDLLLIFNRVGGNLRYLFEITLVLQKDKINFKDSNLNGVLSDSGKKFIKSKDVKFDLLVKERFVDMDDDVKDVLEISSYQGPQFNSPLTCKVAENLNDVSEEKHDIAIDKGVTPYAIITTIDSQVKEFLQGPYWRVAHERLMDDDERSARVASAYSKLALEIDLSASAQLSVAELELIERTLVTNISPKWKVEAYGKLLEVHTHARRYGTALKWLKSMGNLLFAQTNQDCPPPAADDQLGSWDWFDNSESNWPHSRKIIWSLAALETISHFGFQAPKNSELNGINLEKMGEAIEVMIRVHIFEHKSLELNLELDICKSLATFYRTFGHMNNDSLFWSRRITELYEDRLMARYEVANIEEDGDTGLITGTILAALKTVQLEFNLGTPSEEFKENYLKLNEHIKRLPNHQRDIFSSLVHAHKLVFSTLDLSSYTKAEQNHVNEFYRYFYGAAENLGDVLKELVEDYRKGSLGYSDDELTSRLETLSNGNTDVLQALLMAGNLILGISSNNNYKLDPVFTNRLQKVLDLIASHFEKGLYFPRETLESSLDAMLSIAINNYIQGCSDLSTSLKTASSLENACKLYQDRLAGQMELMLLAARIGLFSLDLMKDTDTNQEVIWCNAETVFVRVLTDARLCHDDDRVSYYQEPGQFQESLAKLYCLYLGESLGAEQHSKALKDFYHFTDQGFDGFLKQYCPDI